MTRSDTIGVILPIPIALFLAVVAGLLWYAGGRRGLPVLVTAVVQTEQQRIEPCRRCCR